MPKKFQGENSKAVEARARTNAKKVEENERKEREKEDEHWADDDKNAQKKMQRKEERDKKAQELRDRKLAAKALLEKETEQLAGKSGGGGGGGSQKVTQAEINAQQERQRLERQRAEEQAKMEASKVVIHETHNNLEENVNRLVIEGEQARTVEEALAVLGDASDLDRHPEKRVKASYTAFEDRRMAELKAENPNLRLSQLRQMMKKEWLRSPDNPMNQPRPSE